VQLTESPFPPPVRRRTRRDPRPRFKPERVAQLDAVLGCPSLQVPEGHLARTVLGMVAELDVSRLETQYSSLGRHGYAPRNVLAVWLYASLIGIHHASKVARACQTDAAFRLLSGGYAISDGTLKRFRRRNGTFFADAIVQTVRFARERGVLPIEELAVDSMRLRAHASTKAVRTLKRSRERLEELATIDSDVLSPTEREGHEAKLKKHREAVKECEEKDCTSIVVTNESAALMKFPSGAGLPGHRVTVTAAGISERLVIGVLVDADATDSGKLEAALLEARSVLERAGAATSGLQAAADAGYFSEKDLQFSAHNRAWVDVLITEGAAATNTLPTKEPGLFDRDQFTIHPDRSATCPAGRLMQGPYPHHHGRTMWLGVGCGDCPQRARCTKGKQRTLTANLNLETVRDQMRERLARPGGRERYNQRIATVEPVFANIEDVMGFRRASSRHATTILAEVLLKILAHNVSRLLAARKLSCLWFQLEDEFWSTL